MPLAPTSTRTFLVTSTTAGAARFFNPIAWPSFRWMFSRRIAKEAVLLHEFVIMPNHFHLLLTPVALIPLKRAPQFIKGGFSIARNGKFILLLKYGKQVS